ncbi:MAG: PLP-dependent aminotransferase family protein [Puniceicoccaceae bacterium]
MTMWNPLLDAFPGPRYRAIADALERDLQTGRLPSGTRLPTHRELADRLGVTVGTVTRGYAEAARRGLLRGETGRGTFAGTDSQSERCFEHPEDGANEAVDMGMNLPLHHLDPDLSSTFQKLSSQCDLQSSLRYYPSRGKFQDRELGVEWLREHHLLSSATDRVLITAGGQHALTVILSAAFRPGDALAVERLSYPLIKTLARRFNLRLVPIEMDAEGMLPDALESACKQHTLHGIYCMPGTQNPTTGCMGEERRRALCKVVQQQRLLIVEDDAYALLNPSPQTPLSAACPELGFYIASFSKPVTPGLRFAYLSAPEGYVKRLEHAIADTLWMASPLAARIAREWILDGTAVATIQRKREESRARNLLCRQLLPGVNLRSCDTGYFVWVELPEHWNATDFARQASEHRVIVTPIEHYRMSRDRAQCEAVRVAISGPESREQLQQGLKIIHGLLQQPEFV